MVWTSVESSYLLCRCARLTSSPSLLRDGDLLRAPLPMVRTTTLPLGLPLGICWSSWGDRLRWTAEEPGCG